MAVRGLEEVLARLDRVERRVRTELTRAVGKAGAELRRDLRARTSHAFQEVPSYVRESEMAAKKRHPGYKTYPPGTIGTFARAAPPLEGTPWLGQTQRYTDTPVYRRRGRHTGHPLSSRIAHSPPGDHHAGDRLVSEVGYPPEVGSSPLDEYIVHVLMGTKTMQPRPFLSEALTEFRDAFGMSILEAALTALSAGRGG